MAHKVQGKVKTYRYTVDQFYAGIEPTQRCECKCKASEHIITLRRSKIASVKCVSCGNCTGFRNGWPRVASA